MPPVGEVPGASVASSGSEAQLAVTHSVPPWGLLTKWPPAGEQGTTWQGEELMGHRKCDSQRTERNLCFKLLIPAFCREKSSVNDLNTALLVLISFEWREKTPHLKIITALCFMIVLGWGSGTSTSCMRCSTRRQKWSYRRWLYFGQLALLEPGFRSHLVLVDWVSYCGTSSHPLTVVCRYFYTFLFQPVCLL